MARVLDSFPAPHSQRYPWDEWMDGRPRQLFEREDYTAKTRTLIAAARTQAKRRGGTIKTRIFEDAGRESVVLQFVGR